MIYTPNRKKIFFSWLYLAFSFLQFIETGKITALGFIFIFARSVMKKMFLKFIMVSVHNLVVKLCIQYCQKCFERSDAICDLHYLNILQMAYINQMLFRKRVPCSVMTLNNKLTHWPQKKKILRLFSVSFNTCAFPEKNEHKYMQKIGR